jgi:biopolymer transport protein ExbB/TolQ
MLTFGTAIERLLFMVANALFYPVLIVVILALIYVLVEFGGFLYEMAGHHLRRNFPGFEREVLRAGNLLRNHDPQGAAAALPAVKYSSLLSESIRFIGQALGDGTFHLKHEKIMQNAEIIASRRLQGPRVLTRIGPMLGLMGTLIPLGPALQALTKGDLQTMANNLTIAFVTTVVGLLIGGISYTINLFRDGMLSMDLSDLEYLLTILTRDEQQKEWAECIPEESPEECRIATATL